MLGQVVGLRHKLEILIVFQRKIILKLIFYHLGKVKDDMNQPAVV